MPVLGTLEGVMAIAERFQPTLQRARFLVPSDKFRHLDTILGEITVQEPEYTTVKEGGEGCVSAPLDVVPSGTVSRNIPWNISDAGRRLISVGPLLSHPHPSWETTFWHDLPIDRIEEALGVRRLPGSRGATVTLSDEDRSLTQLQVITRLLGGFMALGSLREWSPPDWGRIAQRRSRVDSHVGATFDGSDFNLYVSLTPFWYRGSDYAGQATLGRSGYRGKVCLGVQNTPDMADRLDGWAALDAATERAVTALIEGNLRLRVASTPASSEPHLKIKVPDSDERRAEILAGLGINEEGVPLNPPAG